jgi:hydroxymethylglutaryl-CoA reductase (NADPH)
MSTVEERGGGAPFETEGAPSTGARPTRRLPSTTDSSREAMLVRHQRLREDGHEIAQITGCGPKLDPAALAGSIEGFIGYACVPLGVAGPLRIDGASARGDFLIPLATSEGTLVASFQHAFNAMNRCGGARALCSHERVSRVPCFEFANLVQAAKFAAWLPTRLPALRETVTGSSRYCRLLDCRASIVGNTVYASLEFATGDAAGQNMVTRAANAACVQLLAEAPVVPYSWLVESMLSGDKRASPLPFQSARGRNATAEIVLPAKQLERYWRTDAEQMARGWRQAVNGATQAGTIGLQGNVANAIAALFIACGQDVACVVEATTALTRIERTRDGSLYASVTLPNLIVGTVGGGTYLPTAQECLSMLRCTGPGTASKFAEICAAVALAGELAIVGAMAGGNFASAHAAGGRRALGDGHEGIS